MLNLHIALGKWQREVGLFFPREPGTHFIIHNYFIIRLVFCKTEVPVTLTFQCLLFTVMRGRVGAKYLCCLFPTILFFKET